MSTNDNILNTNKPRESMVVASGDNVKKTPTATRAEYVQDWLKKQRHAQIIGNFILGYKNKRGGYFVPQILQINDSGAPYVIEQRAPGAALNQELFNSLSPDAKEKVYASLANFVYDMNHCRPMATFEQKLNEPGKSGLDFAGVVARVTPYLSTNDITAINNAYSFFCSRLELVSPVVLFHGDMNENNIFYDDKTGTVSFLDLAEATYENMDYIFDRDLKRLPWLDTQKLAAQYQDMVRPENIRVKSDPAMLDLYNQLRNLKWSGENMIANKNPAIFTAIVQEQIKSVTKSYGNAVAALASQNAKTM
ncbi:MAG: hypothetical protein J5608_02205 [Alphaproteobacteria bacterium]|nr:hypothetical protein [Alphaproteobacteria bacterium]